MKPARSVPLMLSLVVACSPHPLPPQAAMARPVAPSPRENAAIASEVNAPEVASDDESAAVPVRRDNPSWGRRDALVTIVEFADLECPYCAQAESALGEVRRVYGPETIRIVWKHFPLPFHAKAMPAAEAAQGVFEVGGNEAFWKFHDAALRGQGELDLDSFVRWAHDAGISDPALLRSGIASHAWSAKVDRDRAEGALAGVDGTPSFFVNGIGLTGAQPFAEFRRVIDKELAEAQSSVKAGTPRARLYVERARSNTKPPAPESAGPPTLDSSTVYRIPVGDSPSLGRKDAPVTIIEFSDFQCPYCKSVEPTLHVLWDRFGDKIRLVWKNLALPFHPRAEPAAELAMAVSDRKGNAAFWKVHDRMFESQSDLSEATLLRLAIQEGLRENEARTVLAEHSYRAKLEADAALAEDFGAQGTPHFFINGRRVVGAQPADVFITVIDDEIKKAEALIAQGTRPDQVYEAVTKDGQTPPPPATKSIPRSLTEGGPWRGNPRAKVTIHEFADFECPFCSRVDPVLDRVLKEFGDKIKLVWHDLPLAMHPHASLAARAAREMLTEKGVVAFWRLHDKMLAAQDKLTREDLDAYAADLHVSPARWKAALDAGLRTPEIDADARAAGDAGIAGTPAFLIVAGSSAEGYFIEGAQSYWSFRKAIARALGEGP
ncbi:MAG: thioredoxin domain-containing protein [Polyangiaceae bacterium]|jgi:protein-disulfide isomerase